MFAFLKRTSLYILAIPVLFTFLGAASNQLVLIKNGDTFPVMLNDKKLAAMTESKEESKEIHFNKPNPAFKQDGVVMLDDVHCVMTHQTHLNALADIFDMKDAIYSIGDFLLILGEWFGVFCFPLFVFDVVRKLQKV
jgi:hypothetical protein